MRAGDCPCCGVTLDFIFGDPEVEAAYSSISYKLTLTTVEEAISRSPDYRAEWLIAAISAPCCAGLVSHGANFLPGEPTPCEEYGMDLVNQVGLVVVL